MDVDVGIDLDPEACFVWVDFPFGFCWEVEGAPVPVRVVSFGLDDSGEGLSSGLAACIANESISINCFPSMGLSIVSFSFKIRTH